MKVTTETKAVAQAVLDYIAAHPEKHDQSEFITDPDEVTGCGTTMCVAGTANWLVNGIKALSVDSESEGARLLGLDYEESEVLFYEMSNKRALAKLEKVAAGEQFSEEDFYTAQDSEDPDELSFNEYDWERHQTRNNFEL